MPSIELSKPVQVDEVVLLLGGSPVFARCVAIVYYEIRAFLNNSFAWSNALFSIWLHKRPSPIARWRVWRQPDIERMKSDRCAFIWSKNP
jgi:hypothetical protein